MSEAIVLTLCSFEANRREAEVRLREVRTEYRDHQHGLLCFRWRRCRVMERECQRAEARIQQYRLAEEGLRHGDVVPAIAVFDTLIASVQESRFEKVLPALMALGGSPYLVMYGSAKEQIRLKMEALRADLAALRV